LRFLPAVVLNYFPLFFILFDYGMMVGSVIISTSYRLN